MSFYQTSFPYIVQTGTPVTGSFVIDNTTWTSATEIQLHDIPFETFGSGSGGIQLTGSQDVTFSSYYPNLGPGSILFMQFSGSSWSYNIDTITDNTGYVTFDVTNLTGPAGTINPGIRVVQFSILAAGAGSQITNDANNRVLTATGTQGEINAEANLTFSGNTLTVTGDASITGNTTLGNAPTDYVYVTAANIVLNNLQTGTDNTVLIYDSTSGRIESDEIDGRVWGSTLVDATSGADNRVAVFTDANSIEGDDNITWNGNELNINGILSAEEKNFDIQHPSKEGYRLRYSVLEGPERGVYVRGKLRGTNCIELPDYWKDLIYEDSITVHLTPFQNSLPHWLERIELNENKIYIGAECTQPSVDYIVYAERKFETPLTIEYKAEE